MVPPPLRTKWKTAGLGKGGRVSSTGGEKEKNQMPQRMERKRKTQAADQKKGKKKGGPKRPFQKEQGGNSVNWENYCATVTFGSQEEEDQGEGALVKGRKGTTRGLLVMQKKKKGTKTHGFSERKGRSEERAKRKNGIC